MAADHSVDTFLYFETPERQERRDLILHLLHSTEDIIYLKAPKGAGKTEFAKRLLEDESDFAFQWVDAQGPNSLYLLRTVESQVKEKSLICVVIDNADDLAETGWKIVSRLHKHEIAFLLLGEEGPNTNYVNSIEEIGLPAFTLEETRALLENNEIALAEIELNKLHGECKGLPGLIYKALIETTNAGSSAFTFSYQWLWTGLIIILILVVVGGTLLFQDEINKFVSQLPSKPQIQIPAEPLPSTIKSQMEEEKKAEKQDAEEILVDPDEPMGVDAWELDRSAWHGKQDWELDDIVESPQVVDEVKTTKAKPVVKPKPAPEKKKISEKKRPKPKSGIEWLLLQPDKNYTLQLVGARDLKAIKKYIKEKGVKPPHAIFERDLKGKPWYSLVSGSYVNKNAAVKAKEKLPKSIDKKTVWPRTIASVKSQMKK